MGHTFEPNAAKKTAAGYCYDLDVVGRGPPPLRLPGVAHAAAGPVQIQTVQVAGPAPLVDEPLDIVRVLAGNPPVRLLRHRHRVGGRHLEVAAGAPGWQPMRLGPGLAALLRTAGWQPMRLGPGLAALLRTAGCQPWALPGGPAHLG